MGLRDLSEGGGRRMLWIFITLGVQDITSSIARPNVEAHNFKLKSALISMLHQAQFGGASMEDHNLHLSVFIEVCDTLNLNGVPIHVIRLRLFPFSRKDKA